MSSLLIIGAGQYGHLIKEQAESLGFTQIDFLDDNNEEAIGKISELEELQEKYDFCICSIGNPLIRRKITKRIKNKVTLISPKAYVSLSAKIEKGCVIEVGAIINTKAIIEEGSFICSGSVVNHNAVVKKYSQVDCNAVVKGIVPEETKVESCTEWKG